MKNIRQLLDSATQQLQQLSESPRLDAEVLLAHCLNKTRTWLVTWPENIPEDTVQKHFKDLLQQRLAGHPVAHLTGQREFWSLPLKVTIDTLIPRPDTELMIEQVLLDYPADTSLTLADLGTGSGAIALALASERPHWRIIATDQSTAALAVAKENAAQLTPGNIEFRQGSWFEALAEAEFHQQLDVIVSNPPYIPQADPHLSRGDVRFEPLSALASGDDGLDDIRQIVSLAPGFLKPGGRLYIEHGYDQKQKIREIFIKYHFKSIQQHLDLAKKPRLTSGIFN